LRLIGLGDKDLWYDEVVTLAQSRLPLAQLIDAVAHDNYPPLHNLILAPWLGLFGEDAVSLRLLSVLASLVAILFSGLIARDLFGPRAAIVTIALLAFSPLQVRYAQEARMYALLAAFAAIATWALIRWLARPNHRHLALLIFAQLATLYTHYFGAFVVLAHGLAVVWVLLRRRAPRQAAPGLAPHIRDVPEARLPVRPWLVSQLLVVAGFLPWVPIVLERYGKLQGTFWIPEPTAQTLWQFALATWGAAAFLAPLALLALAPAVARFMAPRLSRLLKEPPSVAAPTGTPSRHGLLVLGLIATLSVGLAFVLSYVVQPFFLTRYLIAAALIATILIGGGFSLLGPRASLVLAAVFIALQLPHVVEHYRSEGKERWSSVASQMRKHAHRDDLIVLVPAWQAPALAHHLGEARAPRLPLVGIEGRASVAQILAGSPFPDRLRDAPVVWLVVASDSSADEVARVRAELSAARRVGEVMEPHLLILQAYHRR
jgi:uncharacterized membrane protein